MTLHRPTLLTIMAFAMVGAAFAEMAYGPVRLSFSDILAALTGDASSVAQVIFAEVRAPRALLAVFVGAALAASGTALQGLLRNPLADPGLIGVTAGAAVGAVTVIVLGDQLAQLGAGEAIRPYLIPVGAFAGASVVTVLVFAAASGREGLSTATLILAGVAINAIAGSFIGLLAYISDDNELRELTFWSLGSLGGARWPIVAPVILLAIPGLIALVFTARALDLFQLGERAARHSGVAVEHQKLVIGLATALVVGVVTAAAGPIGFLGLVAPHIARLLIGPTHRMILPGAMLIGAALTLMADLAVRTIAPPAEPPIGIATALIGGPFFLWLVIQRRGL